MTMYPLVDYPKYRESFETADELMAAVDALDATLNFPLSWCFYGPGEEDWEDGQEREFHVAIVMPRRTEVTQFSVYGDYDRAKLQQWLHTTVRARVQAWYGWEEPRVLAEAADGDEVTDEQVGAALTSARRQLKVLFRAFVRNGSDASRLNAVSAALSQIEAVLGTEDGEVHW
jgi:hypothetical protein